MSESSEPFLPYGRHDVDEEDIAAALKVLRGDWLTTGPEIAAFETAFAEKVGAKHAVSCANGTAALHIATAAHGLGQGQVAIVPAVTFQATAASALLMGAEVVFADVDPETALMRPDDLQAAIDHAKATFPDHKVTMALPVHMAGRAVAMAELTKVACGHDIVLIEDASHALGTKMPEGPVGSCARSMAATFSFHPVKTITCGEGGMVTTNDEAYAERLRLFRNHGMVRDSQALQNTEAGLQDDAVNPWYYEVQVLAFNYRLTDLQAALANSQLKRLDDFVAKRQALLSRYHNHFADFDGVSLVLNDDLAATSWHLAVALIDFDRFGANRGDVMRALSASGIGTQVHYMPLYRHPIHEQRYGRQRLAGAEAYYQRALSLPLHVRMDVSDVDRVVDALRSALSRGKGEGGENA